MPNIITKQIHILACALKFLQWFIQGQDEKLQKFLQFVILKNYFRGF